ncbi:metallophosphoesterase family protein [Edaphobacter aggregans]|nr:metallophosphoesterase [Edaphobacter aggregans]
MSRIQQVATQAPPDAKFPRLLAFLQFWKWLLPYLRDFIHQDAPYQTYPNGKSGIFSVAAPPGDGPMRIAVAADWGTGTLEAETVAENMKASSPHYTLHLGDVYYMGEAVEIAENCLGVATKNYTGVLWPTCSLGSFALMGNHEMYSGGQGYFTTFLTTLGLLAPDKTVRDPQSASYFCLEAEHWLVLGLDTGYHSGGVPAFTAIPGLNSIPFFNVDARFDDKMLAWLKQTMDILQAKSSTKKPILLLTHHQPMSSFEHAFKKPVKQLAELGFLNGQEFVWLYGHEHRLTVYEKQTLGNGLTGYPRCIGHGGMPVEITKLSQPDSKIRFYDPRQHPIDQEDPNTKVGYNGHIVLLFDGTKLTIEYRDILNNNLLLTETFTPNGAGGLEYLPVKPADSALLSGQQIS